MLFFNFPPLRCKVYLPRSNPSLCSACCGLMRGSCNGNVVMIMIISIRSNCASGILVLLCIVLCHVPCHIDCWNSSFPFLKQCATSNVVSLMPGEFHCLGCIIQTYHRSVLQVNHGLPIRHMYCMRRSSFQPCRVNIVLILRSLPNDLI
jgi:hypothetical protein